MSFSVATMLVMVSSQIIPICEDISQSSNAVNFAVSFCVLPSSSSAAENVMRFVSSFHNVVLMLFYSFGALRSAKSSMRLIKSSLLGLLFHHFGMLYKRGEFCGSVCVFAIVYVQ